ncbi:hypothetical protein [Ralstonia pseudosolanacearum]|uniref:hypothetical protein n=1 Tax=Ralstonia pseudosolanacearum TaxID=1310165 RepID=UPI0023DC07E3|nr:hypothetical protein [Ralstonia pseudosolanacearum]
MGTQNQAAATAALAAEASAAADVDATKSTNTESTTLADAGTADNSDAPVQTPPPKATRAAAQKRVRARVLVDGRFGSINDVVEIDAEELAGADGELCAHPASVAYALSLK